ncbi:hypothetical protein NQ317_009407 [Molorchus minor]|uniref:RING-type domain-containing protein n=1 Tax=Molorchus minor TaxID=1323400 RepID=A0ABQ9JR78_9CUCU|nr:hypothetical protein NQ317_009407 [Molorchus minor]
MQYGNKFAFNYKSIETYIVLRAKRSVVSVLRSNLIEATMSVLNQSGEEQVECPLCMEPLEVDDLNFFPCTCGYQICRFCWHRIRTDENGLCPACRKAYSENPADFTPLSQEQVAKLKAEKRQRDQQRKAKLEREQEAPGQRQGGAEEPRLCCGVTNEAGRAGGAQTARVFRQIRQDTQGGDKSVDVVRWQPGAQCK